MYVKVSFLYWNYLQFWKIFLKLNYYIVQNTFIYKKIYLNRPTPSTKEAYDLRVLEWIDEAEEVLKIIQYGAKVAYQEGLINQNKDTRQKRFFMSGNLLLIFEKYWNMKTQSNLNLSIANCLLKISVKLENELDKLNCIKI